MAILDHIPWTIASGASTSGAIDIGADSVIVAIIAATNGVWTATGAKIAFTVYVPDTGGQGSGLDWAGSDATYVVLLNDVGVAIAFGDGTSIITQYITLGVTAASPAPIAGVRYVKVRSGSVAGAVITGINQAQKTTGYLVTRRGV